MVVSTYCFDGDDRFCVDRPRRHYVTTCTEVLLLERVTSSQPFEELLYRSLLCRLLLGKTHRLADIHSTFYSLWNMIVENFAKTNRSICTSSVVEEASFENRLRRFGRLHSRVLYLKAYTASHARLSGIAFRGGTTCILYPMRNQWHDCC